MQLLLQRLEAEHGPDTVEAIAMASQPNAPNVDRKALCDATRALYRTALGLPHEQQSVVLRSLLQRQQRRLTLSASVWTRCGKSSKPRRAQKSRSSVRAPRHSRSSSDSRERHVLAQRREPLVEQRLVAPLDQRGGEPLGAAHLHVPARRASPGSPRSCRTPASTAAAERAPQPGSPG